MLKLPDRQDLIRLIDHINNQAPLGEEVAQFFRTVVEQARAILDRDRVEQIQLEIGRLTAELEQLKASTPR